MSAPGEALVLGCQLTVSLPSSSENDLVAELEKMTHSSDRVNDFLKSLSDYSSQNKVAVKATSDPEKRVRYKEKDGKWQTYGADIKIMDSKPQVTPTGNIYLIEFQ